MSLGIAGFGFVGQTVYECAADKDIIVHDPPKGKDNYDGLLETDGIFICLPTPSTKGKQDPKIVHDFLDGLVKSKYTGVVIMKSTFLYSNIKGYLGKLKIVINPEFLSENSRYKDFYEQKYVILGGDVDACDEVIEIYDKYFNLRDDVEYCKVNPKEAIDIKYTHNVYHAYKVLFWNAVAKAGVNHRLIAKHYKLLTEHFDNNMDKVAADGNFGYGGHCFPKDVAAFNDEYPNTLTEFMQEYNSNIRID